MDIETEIRERFRPHEEDFQNLLKYHGLVEKPASQPGRLAYITLFGNMTGDVVHCIALHCLSRILKPDTYLAQWNFEIALCLVRFEDRNASAQPQGRGRGRGPGRARAPDRGRGGAADRAPLVGEDTDAAGTGASTAVIGGPTFDWARQLNVPLNLLLLSGVPLDQKAGRDPMSMLTFGDIQTKSLRFANKDLSSLTFEELRTDDPGTFLSMTIDHETLKSRNRRPDNVEREGIVPLWASTTALVELIEDFGLVAAQEIISSSLIRNMTIEELEMVTEQINNLEKQMKSAKNCSGGFLFFNYRQTGPGEVNSAYDSDDYLLYQVVEAAEKHDIRVIVIPAGQSKTRQQRHVQKTLWEKTCLVFDLHQDDAREDDHDSQKFKSLDLKRMRAFFWRFIAYRRQKLSRLPGSENNFRSRNVIGLIGGRSGSIDAAALVGVRCLAWEMELHSAVKSHGIIAQMLRHLNQMNFMSIIFRPWRDVNSSERSELNHFQLHDWLKSDSFLIKSLYTTSPRSADISAPLIGANLERLRSDIKGNELTRQIWVFLWQCMTLTRRYNSSRSINVTFRQTFRD